MGYYDLIEEATMLLRQARAEGEGVGYAAGKKDNERVTLIQEKLRRAAVLSLEASKSLQRFVK